MGNSKQLRKQIEKVKVWSEEVAQLRHDMKSLEQASLILMRAEKKGENESTAVVHIVITVQMSSLQKRNLWTENRRGYLELNELKYVCYVQNSWLI